MSDHTTNLLIAALARISKPGAWTQAEVVAMFKAVIAAGPLPYQMESQP